MKSDKLNILVVDDDSFVREMLSEILAEEGGYNVSTAENGSLALASFNNGSSPDLVVSDMDMPVMNGLDLIKKVRETGAEVPIIILTGNDEINVAINAMNCGASDYLLKDGNIEETISLSVAKAIEKKRIKDENKALLKALEEKNRELSDLNEALGTTVGKLTRIGTSLSSEKSLNRLLEMIVDQAMDVTNADGGSLYILENGKLSFAIAKNISLNLNMGGEGGDAIKLPPVELDKSNVSAYSAITRESINIDDVYECRDFDFSGPKKFDQMNGYTTKSMLVVPMLDRNGSVTGALQLINSKDKYGKIKPFFISEEEIVNSLACQAGVCIESAKTYEKLELKNVAFLRFVPTEFLSYFGKKEVEDIRLGEVSCADLSVLFSDIRSFTNLSESMSPEECFRFLNAYLNQIAPEIEANSGFIDKYIGDAIMALFPGGKTAHAGDAVRAAVGMQNKVKIYNAFRKKTGYAPISIGVGIHSGPLTLGTLGFEKRMDSTVIGDTVNLSSRMEGLTKLYSISIAITSSTYDQLENRGDFMLREIDTVKVKGRENPVTVYEVFDCDDERLLEHKARTIDRFSEGISLYKEGRFQECNKLFEEISRNSIYDSVAEIYLSRCRRYMDAAVDEEWEHVTRL